MPEKEHVSAAAELRPQDDYRQRGQQIAGSRPNERAALLVGRAVFGGFFLVSGFHHFLDWNAVTSTAKGKGVPLPGVAVAGSGALLVIGGLSILIGMRPKIGASLIGAFLLGVTPRMHAFWHIEERDRRTQEMVNFTKNLALIGGAALTAAVPEPWPASIARR